jgi:hypothetical protein
VFFYDKICELALKTRRLYNVIVYPMIVPPAWFSKNDMMIPEPMPAKPFYRNAAVFFGPGSKNGNDMAFVVPLIEDFQGIWIRKYR